MRIEGPLRDATFVDRPNRFLTVVDLDGRRVESHLPDPGRLRELLLPGARLKIRDAAGRIRTHRKTRWTTIMVKTGKVWVSVDSTLPNRWVAFLLERGELEMFRGYRVIGKEVTHGRHRFDFLLEKGGVPFYLEVKSVTLVEDGVAMFPDAVSERGRRHMEALSVLARSGMGAGVLFVCQRPDARLFRPQWDTDPAFARALVDAEKKGVTIWAVSSRVTPGFIRYHRAIPYDLSPS
ncbi:MAG: DNA/RNA nuclease SfsA [Fidelibacterota bacterium]